MKRRRHRSRRPWRVVCPDGHLRAFPQMTKTAACEVALEKTVAGCKPFPDDPERWWTRRCKGGVHQAVKVRR